MQVHRQSASDWTGTRREIIVFGLHQGCCCSLVQHNGTKSNPAALKLHCGMDYIFVYFSEPLQTLTCNNSGIDIDKSVRGQCLSAQEDDWH